MRAPARVAVAAALGVLAGVAFGGVALLGAMLGSVPGEDQGGCLSDPGSVPVVAAGSSAADLTSAQLANAGTVVAVGRRLGVPRRGVLVALAVASQESRFTNYANDGRGGDLQFTQVGIEQSLELPHEAVGSDHGSVGMFQQQWPWWGSLRELMDPATSAEKFYLALGDVPGWQSMPVTVAAQRVQRSAYPDAYADDEALAQELLGGSAPLARSASWTGPDPACEASVATGDVAHPLPRSAASVDRRNWGSHGSRWAAMHTGTDFSVACGTPVLAATAGRAVVRTDQSWAGRWLVQVSTGTGRLTTWYAHMQRLVVADGQEVRAGQRLGDVGALGNASGCHLHFEVHPRGGAIYRDSVDPSAWLRDKVGRPVVEAAGASGSPSAPTSGSSSDPDWFTVATLNVLGASHTAPGGKLARMASGSARTRGVVALLEKYGVDVIGLQELQAPQRRELTRRAGSEYQVWHPAGDTENAVAWRRDRFRLVKAQTLAIPYFAGRPRRMPVLHLADQRTGRRVAVMSVHHPADTPRFPDQARWRRTAVARETALVRRLSRSGTRVIVTGDMNDRRGVFCRYTAKGLATSSNADGSGPGCTPPRRAGIDWIFGSRGVRFSDHTVERSGLVRATTDHPFVVARAQVSKP